MSHRRRTILLVPPHGTRVRAVRIRAGLIFVLALFLTVGFAGYFIPFHSFTLDIVEQNQMRNLTTQNKELLERILSMLKLLNAVRAEIAKVEAKKDAVGLIAHIEQPSAPVPGADTRASAASMGVEQLLKAAGADERTLAELWARVKKERTFFSSRPVLLPIARNASVSVQFGKTRDPFTGKTKWHRGVDFVAPRDAAIVATADGVVVAVAEDKQWGRRVVIDHGNGLTTVYAHLGTVTTAKGRTVSRGEQIASIGLSGITTGPHLHYEVRKGDVPVDPRGYFYPELDSLLVAMTGK